MTRHRHRRSVLHVYCSTPTIVTPTGRILFATQHFFLIRRIRNYCWSTSSASISEPKAPRRDTPSRSFRVGVAEKDIAERSTHCCATDSYLGQPKIKLDNIKDNLCSVEEDSILLNTCVYSAFVARVCVYLCVAIYTDPILFFKARF